MFNTPNDQSLFHAFAIIIIYMYYGNLIYILQFKMTCLFDFAILRASYNFVLCLVKKILEPLVCMYLKKKATHSERRRRMTQDIYLEGYIFFIIIIITSIFFIQQ